MSERIGCHVGPPNGHEERRLGIDRGDWLIGWTLFIRGRCHALPDDRLMCQNEPDGIVSFLGDLAAWTPMRRRELP